MNDEEFKRIKNLSNQIDPKVLILFWQFTISTLDELSIVSNQHLSIEMFLIRLMHLSSMKSNHLDKDDNKSDALKKTEIEKQSSTINQIKNITQEEKSKPEIQKEIKSEKKLYIQSLEDLIEVCIKHKELKLKYELEKNVNLVKFEKNLIEISFNESLDKNFVKDLSSKLFEWTGERWIITLSQIKGEISIENKKKNLKKVILDKAKKLEIYKDVLKNFPDAELMDLNLIGKENNND